MAVVPLPPEGDQAYDNGADPPFTETVAEPSLPPLQETFVEVLMVAVGPLLLATTIFPIAVHPFASVTITL